MKDVAHQHVVVVSFNADNGKFIQVVVCDGPPEAYASKDQKHLCFIREAKLVLPDKDPQPISENEEKMILRSFFALRGVITNLFESAVAPEGGSAKPLPIHGSLAAKPNESAP